MSKLITNLKEKYFKKRVLIVGLGLQGGGVGLAKFFAELGADVTVTDKKTKEQLLPSLDKLKKYPIKFRFGQHQSEDFLKAEVIFKGPSIKWDMPEIIQAEKKGTPIEMEASFFAGLCPGKIVGITGTRGKSTTTYLVYKLLQENGFSAHLAGNIPDISTISLLDKISQNDWVVMELASWPLSGFARKKISPHIAVFTNIYPDHLNYYSSMSHYVQDKKAIYLFQKKDDYLVANISLKPLIENDFVRSKINFFSENDWKYELEFLKGTHNQENAAAAIKVAEILNINKQKAIRSISSFKGLPHRQEIIRRINNVLFVNDTTSTTPVAVVKAIQAFVDSGKIYLLFGGTSKNLPYEILFKHLDKVEKIILLAGSFTDEIYPVLKSKYPQKITSVYSNLGQAFFAAYGFAVKTGGCVLFSPGAPSFAMFNNEFHRGEEFVKLVNKIK